MADNIVKLKVDSEEYESKIKRASQGLQALGRNLHDAGKTFADAEAKQVEFVRELGKMQTVSNTAKGKIAEMSAAFIDLKSQYLRMTNAEKQSPIGQAMAKSLEELKQRTIDAKRELEGLNNELNGTKTTGTSGGGGGIGNMLAVFGGNLMTKAAGMAVGFVTELGDAVKQGVELAKQGEGIRIAFERLGRGDILDGLRQATHGTVTDIELMKAAVKFNDFKLPVEELGTMLAFAQQKAKDTGQSVDYMVDSIVTGLGRKSLMILDNLGLSATEVKEKMKETGDMTKAVGAIIREQMSKAGDYVETAADRAAQANVSLQNKMEELGRKFAPVEEASSQLWTSMKIGILDIIGGPLATLINQLTEAGRLKNALNDINGTGSNTKLDRMLGNLRNASEGNRQSIYQQQQAEIWKYINSRENYFKDRGSWVNTRDEGLRQSLVAREKSFGTSNVNDIKAQIGAAKQLLANYIAGAKGILSPAAITGTSSGKGGSGDKGGPSMPKNVRWDNYIDKVNLGAEELKGSDIKETMSVWAQMSDEAKKSMLGLTAATEDLGDAQAKMWDKWIKSDIQSKLEQQNKLLQEQQTRYTLAGQAAQNFGSALAGLEDPAAKAAGTVMQAVASIALGFATASSTANTAGTGWGWLAWLAAGTAAMATTISTIHSLTGYAEGGIVKGNSYSGDNMMFGGDGLYGLNAGEVVLTKAQQSNLANSLEGGSTRTIHVVGKISGNDILLSADRSLRLQGKELAVWGR